MSRSAAVSQRFNLDANSLERAFTRYRSQAPARLPPTAQGRPTGGRVGCVNAFMQLVGTRKAGPQGGRIGALGFVDPLRRGSARWMD